MTKKLLSALAAGVMLIAVSAVGGSGTASAEEAEPLEVIVFPGGFNWPIFVAKEGPPPTRANNAS